MSKFTVKVKHLPSITEFNMSASQPRNILESLGLHELHLWDNKYFYCSHEDWGKVLEKVLLDMPKYTAERFDCSNFAMLASARTSELFKLNTCGICVGQSPWGYHGFCLFLSRVDNEDKLFILEPQNGLIYPIEEPEGYKPELLIMG